MKMKNKFGFKFGASILSLLFLSHLFVLEKYRNGFLEYDLHFFSFFFLLFSVYSLIISCTSVFINSRWRMDTLTVLYTLFAVYITILANVYQNLDVRYVLFVWLFLISFFLFKYSVNYFSQLSFCLVVLALFIAVIKIANVQVFQSTFFLKNTSFINSGENANYYASVLPFIFSLMFEKKRTRFSKFFFVLALMTFLISIYILATSSARIACIAALFGVAVVAFNVWNVDEKILKKAKPFLWKSILVTLATVVLLFFGKVLYDQNSNSVKGRFLIYEISLQMIKSSPIWGHGPQSFKTLYNIYQSNYLRTHDLPVDRMLLADNSYYAFNEFIQIFVEFGIAGLFVVISTICICYNALKQKSDGKYSNLELGAAGALLSVGMCALFSYPLHTLSILLNCVFYLAIVSKKSKAIFYFNLNKSKVIFLAVAGLVFSFFLSLREVNRIVALQNWEKAAHLALVGDFNVANSYYKKAKEELNNDGAFLYNYGSESFIAGFNRQSFLLLRRSALYYSNTNLYVYLGNCYKNMKDYSNAELYYQTAEYMQPSKFLPKFQLLLLYQEYGFRNKAIATARKIIAFPVKVPSSVVESYKSYANEFLNSKNTN